MVHIALQELQAVTLMLCKIAFQLSRKAVALHLDNSTAKAYLFSQDGTVSLFLSKLASCILNLINKNGITLIPTHILTHLNVETDNLSWGRFVPEWHLPPLIVQAVFQLWGSTRVGSVGILTYLSISSSHISSPSSVQVSGRTCHRSIQNSYCSYTLFSRSFFTSHSSQHVGRHSLLVSYCKKSHYEWLNRLGVQGSAVAAFNCLDTQRCVFQRQGFSSSVSFGQWQGRLQCLQEKFTSNAGKNGFKMVY